MWKQILQYLQQQLEDGIISDLHTTKSKITFWLPSYTPIFDTKEEEFLITKCITYEEDYSTIKRIYYFKDFTVFVYGQKPSYYL